ncbi:MAG: hypothetical protein M3198_12725 [Actinomycetota bacterium]|nr:hypothetical protein [Actinomycetota bacterium]
MRYPLDRYLTSCVRSERTTLSEQQWRLIWEGQLDPETRRRIWRAAFTGAPIRQRDEAAIAIEFARRRRRLARSAAIINSVMFVALLLTMAIVYDPPVASTFWFMVGVWLFGLIGSPVVALLWRQRLQQWEERNRRVLRDADG